MKFKPESANKRLAHPDGFGWWEEMRIYSGQQTRRELNMLKIEINSLQLWTGRLSFVMHGADGCKWVQPEIH